MLSNLRGAFRGNKDRDQQQQQQPQRSPSARRGGDDGGDWDRQPQHQAKALPQPPMAPRPGQPFVMPVRGSSHPASIFNLPPKKVVRANGNYTARYVGELSFEKGDFFYVINERPDGLTYEVINPVAKSRGLVPTSFFDSLDKVQQQAQQNMMNQQDGDMYNQQRDSYADYDNVNGNGNGNMGNNDYGNQAGNTDSYYDDGYGYDDRTPNNYGNSSNQYGGGGGGGGSSGARSPMSPGAQQDDLYYDSYGNASGGSRSPMSPSTPRGEKRIWTVLVQRAEQKDSQWVFTIELKMTDNTSNILFRTYDDFWALQVALLNHFPAESGRGNQPRSIPFLAQPIRNMSSETYLQELVKLPAHVNGSPSVKRFFMVRTGDLETAVNIRFDVSETLMDLLNDYEEDSDVRIKLVLGEEIIAWKEPDFVSYEELVYHAEDRLGFRFQALMYKDECEELIPLRGDGDLGLLINTYSKKLTFYVS
ncbi:hypothetical protein BC831DRAFT_444300 [Entophlyctis helioformis]|nr:hypothetical protein BC831DRAFT_444300 [Entophlyctis helioformis]